MQISTTNMGKAVKLFDVLVEKL